MTAATALRDAYVQLVQERGLVPDPAQQAVVEQLAALAERIAQSRPPGTLRRALAHGFPTYFTLTPPRGLYLWGGVGRGKTWLMDLFVHHVAARGHCRTHFHHFMRDIHAQLARLDRSGRPLERVARELAARTRLLCVDELFVADIGDAMILHGLVTALLREGVTLVFTSNWPPGRLYEGGLQRERFLPAIDLLERHLDVVHIATGTDYRLRHLEHAGTYVLSEAADAREQLRILFERLASEPEQGGELQIDGRSIPVLRTASGMAWFDFTALCEGPRSANDYIEIAGEHHTVFVTGVPVMDALRDDAARRFMALIDEFYDRNVKLVISAAAEPMALYRGERLKFAFARTASRLVEMRSHDYLAREHRATG